MTTSPWTTLLPAALAGTRRQPLAPLPGLTPPLGSETGAAEGQLLLTAANLTLVQRAGRRPAPGPAEALGRADAETWPALGPAGRRLVQEQLADPDQSWSAWAGFLAELHQLRRRVPHQQLPAVLACVAKCGSWLLSRYAAAFGARGRWLAAHYGRADVREQATRMGTRWDAGQPLSGQGAVLAEWFRTDPLAAAQRIAAALPHETSENQFKLVRWLEIETQHEPVPPGLAPALQPLLASPYGRGSEYESLPQTAASLLCRMPGPTELAAYYWALAAPLLVLERPATGPPRLRPTLPAVAERAAPTASFTFSHHFSGRGTKQLEQLLAHVPPSRWAAAWGVSPAEAVALAAASAHAPLLLRAWLAAVHNTRDAAFAPALLAHAAAVQLDDYRVNGASDVLPEHEQAAWVQALLPALPTPPVAVSAYHGPLLPWWLHRVTGLYRYRPAVVRVLLTFLRGYLAQPPSPGHDLEESNLLHMLREMSQQAGPSLLPLLETELLPVAQPRFSEPLREVVSVLRRHQALADSAAEPPGRDN